MLQSRHDELPPFPPGSLKLQQSGRRRLSPFRQEDDKGQRLQGVLEEFLKVHNGGIHQLLAKGRIGLEGAAMRLKVEYRPEKIPIHCPADAFFHVLHDTHPLDPKYESMSEKAEQYWRK